MALVAQVTNTLGKFLVSLSSLVGRYSRDTRGNFAITTAIMAVPMFMIAGLTIDYTRVLDYKAILQQSADAAVLASIAEESKGRERAYKMKKDGEIKIAEKEAMEFFDSNLPKNSVLKLAEREVSVQKYSDRIVAEVNYSLDMPMAFGSFFGQQTFPITGSSKAEIRLDAAIDFYLLLDNTPSMGLGATTADIAKLMSYTPDKCAFACHALNDGDNYYNLARDHDIDLRIDVVRQAVQQLTDTASDVRTFQNQFRMAVYSFGEAATNMGLTEVSKLSSNMNKVKSDTDDLDLMTIPYQNYNNDQQTDFDNTLSDMNDVVPDPGTGIAGDEPQKVVFFVSDGVADSYKPYACSKSTTQGRCQEPISLAQCTALKARGIKIAVLYTTYLPLPTNSWYSTWIRPFETEIPTKMESCATPGLYFEVSPSEGIPEAMDSLFRKTLTKLRLTS